jgi:flagellar FliL protein
MSSDDGLKAGKVNASLDAPAEGGEGAAEGEAGAEGGGGKKKLILMIAIPLILLIAVGAGLYFTGTIDKLMGKKDEAAEGEAEAGGGHGGEKAKVECKEGEHGEKVCSGGDAFFLEIPNMIVNLNSPEGQQRYLRLSVQLELGSEADKHAVETVMPRVVDQFQTYLRELRVKDLRGSQGIYRLQMELLARVNAAAYPVEVKDVLFQEILIQ